MTAADRAFVEQATFRERFLPQHWVEPDLVEQGGSFAQGPLPFTSLATLTAETTDTSWVVHAAAGLGKTALLRALEVRLLRAGTPVLYLNAAALRTLTITKKTNAVELVRAHRPAPFPERYWNACLKRKDVVILLDGVNEIRREFATGPTWRLIGAVLGGNHGLTVVATSRDPDEDAGEMRPVRRLKLQDFTRPQASRYLAESGLDAARCLDWLDGAGLTGAYANPLLLRCFVVLMRSGTASDGRPVSRAELLRSAALVNMERGRIAPEVTQRIEAGVPIEAAWAACAARGHFGKGGQFTRQELLKILQSCPALGESDLVMDLFLEAGPVDRVPGGSPYDPVRFALSHQRYAELGLALGWGDAQPAEITHHSHYFGGFIADWCAVSSDPVATVRKLAPRLIENEHYDTLCDLLVANTPLLDSATQTELWDLLGRAFTLAPSRRRRLADAVAALPRPLVRHGLAAGFLRRLGVERPDVAGYVRDQLLSGTLDGQSLQRIFRQADRRRSLSKARQGMEENDIAITMDPAVERPTTLDPGRAVPPSPIAAREVDDHQGGGDTRSHEIDWETRSSTDDLVRLLFDGEKPTRVRAASELSRRVDEDAVSNLGNRFPGLNDTDTAHLATALGRIGSQIYVAPLATLLGSPTLLLRRKAIIALSRIGGREALQLIRQHIDDPDSAVRATVANALGQVGELADLPSLIALTEDADRRTQYTAIGAIARYLNFRGSTESSPLHTQECVDDALVCLENTSPTALVRVCWMLRTTAIPQRAGVLERWTAHTVPKVRGAALTVLAEVDSARALRRARTMLLDDDEVNRSAAITVIGATGAVDDAELLRPFLHDQATTARGAACQALARLGDVNEVDTIAALMSDPDDIVRGSACTAMGLLAISQTIPILITRLEDPSANVRGSAAKALGLLGASEAVPQLCRALQDSVDRVRGTVAVALGTLGDPFAVPSLIPLAKDHNSDVRKGAVFALGRIADSDGVPAIIEATADEVSGVRWNAATALGRVGDLSAVNLLAGLLSDSDSHVRGASATSLGHLGSDFAAKAVMRAAGDPHPRVRGSVATALGRIGDPIAIEVLLTLASDADAIVRSAAISAVGRAAFVAGIDAVHVALTDEYPEVRGAALRALARLDPGRDITPFLADSDASVRRAGLAAIGESGGPGENRLLQALHDEDAETRSVAVAALARRPSDVAIAGIVDALDDASPSVGQTAISSLGHLVEPQGLPKVINALASDQREIRLAAADLLGTLGDRQALSPLHQMLLHRDGRSRVAAAQALGHIGLTDSAPALIKALQDADEYVRGEAAVALGRVGVGSQPAKEALLALLADSSQAVVGLAARSLGALGGEGVADRLKQCALDTRHNLWTRASAVQAAARLHRRPQPWMRDLADENDGGSATSGQAKFRGAIIDAVVRGGWNEDVAVWTRKVLLTDPDPVNQTAAATGLGAFGQMSPDLARDFIFGGAPTANQSGRSVAEARRRNSAATGAVLRGAIRSARDDGERAAVVEIVAAAFNGTNSTVLASSTLSAIGLLDPAEAISFLGALNRHLAADTRNRFGAIIERLERDANRRLDDAAAYERLASEPHRFLSAFVADQNRRSVEKMPGCEIGIVTIIGEEARAVSEWLLSQDPLARRRGPDHRIVYQANVAAGNGSVRVITTQALDQGQTSATNAFHYLKEHFRPQFMVLLGIAGGIHPDVSLGDVVIGTQVIDYGPAASTAGGVRHRGSAFRPPMHIVAALNDFFASGGEPRRLAAHADGAALAKPYFTLQRGPIGTGPRVVKFRDAEERKFLESYNEKTLALETEAEGIARYFYEQGENNHFSGYMVIRAISDHADEAKDDSWKLAASRNAVVALSMVLPAVKEATPSTG